MTSLWCPAVCSVILQVRRRGWEDVSGILLFFSSRRRHTRCSRDWSSDVCSSDLYSIYISTRFYCLIYRIKCNRLSGKDKHAFFTMTQYLILLLRAATVIPSRPLMEIGRASCRERV